MRRAIGWAMVAAPFVGLFGYLGANHGWLESALLFGAVAALVAWIQLAVWLAAGGEP